MHVDFRGCLLHYIAFIQRVLRFNDATNSCPRLQIYSVEDERIVGISLPDDSEVRWFTLKAGTLAYDPDTMNYFALKKVRGREAQAGPVVLS